MSLQYVWGEQGEYGPFSAGEDGYPHAGEVVRYFRILRGMSAIRFGEEYALALGEKKPKTRIWVLTMERTNNVPVDITRRRAIATILGIPPVLLGISESILKTPLLPDTPAATTPRIPLQETLITEALTDYEQALKSYIDGFFHRHGQAILHDITSAVKQISTLLPQAREHNRQQGTILISQYHQFANSIAREQQEYDLGIAYADKALKHAQEVHKVKPDSNLMAIVAYRRGMTSFEQESTLISQPSNLQDAASYMDAALSYAQSSTPLVQSFISLEWGLIHAYTALSEKERTVARTQLINSYHAASAYRQGDDIYGIRYDLSWYHLTYAEALIALGEYSEALGQLEVAEEYTPLTFPRRFAIIDLLRAKAHLGLREFPEAVSSAHDALTESKAVKSALNIAHIANIYRQLRQQYKHASDLTDLGRELEKTHPRTSCVSNKECQHLLLHS